jgi:glycogen(starch) synthase
MTKPGFLVEVSYEVCNQVGGIYTLLASKAPHMAGEYGKNYLLIGPYVHEKAVLEFEEQNPPAQLAGVIDGMMQYGVKCHYGRWLIDGSPNAVLVDYSGYYRNADDIKKGLWEFAGVDSLFSDSWYTDPLVWSTASGLLIEKLVGSCIEDYSFIAHFHEWISGGGLLKLKCDSVDAQTVFTTHATVLGRTLSDAGEPIYQLIKGSRDAEKIMEMARIHNVLSKHTMEAACAVHADYFTTVSEITAREAAYFLGRTADFLLPGGINLGKYAGADEIAVERNEHRRQMNHFLASYFDRYYFLDFENMRSIFISGRYEFHNKGVDIFLDALGMLNERMKKEQLKRQVVSFIFIPSATKGEDFQVLKNKSLYDDLREHVAEMLPKLEDDMLHSITEGETPKDLLDDGVRQEMKRLSRHFAEKKGGVPPLCAFELAYPPEQDFIMQALWKNGLLNRKEDRVKVVYYPSYLSAADRLIAMDYEQAVMTCDAGVFPSYYEPWGYTPLETAALGCISVTTDLAGFGLFIKGRGKGIYVLEREGREAADVIKDLSDKLYKIATMPDRELAECKTSAKELSTLADWKTFIQNYINLYQTILKKV